MHVWAQVITKLRSRPMETSRSIHWCSAEASLVCEQVVASNSSVTRTCSFQRYPTISVWRKSEGPISVRCAASRCARLCRFCCRMWLQMDESTKKSSVSTVFFQKYFSKTTKTTWQHRQTRCKLLYTSKRWKNRYRQRKKRHRLRNTLPPFCQQRQCLQILCQQFI